MDMQHPRLERGFAHCRLCDQVVPLDDMAVMTYPALPVPPCCQACWDRTRDAHLRRDIAGGALDP